MVAGRPDAIALAMSQLALDPVPVEIALTQDNRRETAEAVHHYS